MVADPFVCPECHLSTRPAAMFFSRGNTWWSASPTEEAMYRDRCRDRRIWPNGTILGCPSMRAAINPWLRAAPPDPEPLRSRAPAEVSIADIATASFLVQLRNDLPVATAPAIGESFRDLELAAALRRNPGSAEVKNYELRDVILDPTRMILVRDGARITETRYILSDDDYALELDETRVVREIDAGKTVVVGFNLAYRNHYHWLMQSLPALDHSIRVLGAANCILALPSLSDNQEEALEILGYARIPRVEIDPKYLYLFRRAHYCTFLNGTSDDFLSPDSLDLLGRLAAGVDAIPSAPERIYVSRLDSKQRVIANEVEVRRLLEARGFVPLALAFLPLRTQIGLFRAARVVVGAHGAGLANLAFCQPGTTVLELIQSTYPMLLMNRIAQHRGLRYHAEYFECEATDNPHEHEWTVDTKLLETKLSTLL